MIVLKIDVFFENYTNSGKFGYPTVHSSPQSYENVRVLANNSTIM